MRLRKQSLRATNVLHCACKIEMFDSTSECRLQYACLFWSTDTCSGCNKMTTLFGVERCFCRLKMRYKNLNLFAYCTAVRLGVHVFPLRWDICFGQIQSRHTCTMHCHIWSWRDNRWRPRQHVLLRHERVLVHWRRLFSRRRFGFRGCFGVVKGFELNSKI